MKFLAHIFSNIICNTRNIVQLLNVDSIKYNIKIQEILLYEILSSHITKYDNL